MKVKRFFKAAALAGAIVGCAAAAQANTVTTKDPIYWVVVSYTGLPPNGQPAQVNGVNNYPTEGKCLAALHAFNVANPTHFNYCAVFNHDAPMAENIGGEAVTAPPF